MPCVVSISAERMTRAPHPDPPVPEEFWRRFYGDRLESRPGNRPDAVPQRGTGSGIVVDGAGYIVTNFHVIRDVDELRVTTHDRRNFTAQVVGTDPKSDVAVIKIQVEPGSLAVARWGDSDGARVGEFVVAIGAPFGLAHTVTSGIISAKGRANVGVADYEDFLQTDAAINPGNSGGPLVNMRGEVIGMNTAIATMVGQYSGVGFSIPANMLKRLVPVLMRGDPVARGMLGVLIQDVTDDLAHEFRLPHPTGKLGPRGALVTRVNEGSPAQRAGLKPGDIIVRFQGREVDTSHQLRKWVSECVPESRVELVCYRAGKESNFTVVVGQLVTDKPSAPGHQPGSVLGRVGLDVRVLVPAAARALGWSDRKGVFVSRVDDGSPAAAAGVQVGDLILEVDRQRIESLTELERALVRSGQNLLLVHRPRGSLFVILRGALARKTAHFEPYLRSAVTGV
jgi:serine protease Do